MRSKIEKKKIENNKYLKRNFKNILTCFMYGAILSLPVNLN